jgi:hypothetical protein
LAVEGEERGEVVQLCLGHGAEEARGDGEI